MLKDFLMKEEVKRYYTLKYFLYALIALIGIFTFFNVFYIEASATFTTVSQVPQYDNLYVNGHNNGNGVVYQFSIANAIGYPSLFGTINDYNIFFTVDQSLTGIGLPIIAYILVLLGASVCIVKFFVHNKKWSMILGYIAAGLYFVGGFMLFFTSAIYEKAITNLFTEVTGIDTLRAKCYCPGQIYNAIKFIIFGGVIMLFQFVQDLTLFETWQKIKMFFINSWRKIRTAKH